MAQCLKRLNLVSTFTVSRVYLVARDRTPISRTVQRFVQFGSRLHEVRIDSLSRKRPGYRLTRFNCNCCKSCVDYVKRFRPAANETFVMFLRFRLNGSRSKLYNIQWFKRSFVTRVERIIFANKRKPSFLSRLSIRFLDPYKRARRNSDCRALSRFAPIQCVVIMRARTIS